LRSIDVNTLRLSGPEFGVPAGRPSGPREWSIPRSGAFLWHVGGSNQFPIPAPTFHDGVLYMTRGYRSGPYMAIRPGGRGDISTVQKTPAGTAILQRIQPF
jgi:hypothetical protein